MSDETNGLTGAEREAFARLATTLEVDLGEQERTVRRLREEGLLGVRGPRTEGEGRERRGRASWLRVGLAVAAGLACFIAGLWSERAGLWSRQGGTTGAAIVLTQASAPIVRF